MKHILTPFNGMHSGFNDDGTPNSTLTAQIATLKRVLDFAPQNNATTPQLKFGFFKCFITKYLKKTSYR